jgi:hypothetical protein
MRRWDDNNFGKNEVGLSSVERFIFHNSKNYLMEVNDPMIHKSCLLCTSNHDVNMVG